MTETLADSINRAIKPIIEEHTRAARDANCALQRDLNEAHAHLKTAKEVCERLTKQGPQTQQDGPWCVIGCTLVKGPGRFSSEVPVAFESTAAGWSEDVGLVFLDRAGAERAVAALRLDFASDAGTLSKDVFSIRVETVSDWQRIVRASGSVKR